MAKKVYDIDYSKDGLTVKVNGQTASGLTGIAKEIHVARVVIPETAGEAEVLALMNVGPVILYGSDGTVILGENEYKLPKDAGKVPVIDLFNAIPQTILGEWLGVAYRENPNWTPDFGPRTDDYAKKN